MVTHRLHIFLSEDQRKLIGVRRGNYQNIIQLADK